MTITLHTHTHTRTRMYKHTHTHTHVYKHTDTHTYKNTHTYKHTRTHTHTQSYTSTLPGATVSFSTTDRNGHKEVGVAVVRGNGDSPLQLPFVLFGLGETPNFIESLTTGAGYTLPPGNVSVWRTSYKVWSLLVPNSQVVVLTQHPDDSGR